MDIIISFLSDFGYAALFICMFLENMNIPIPSEVILGFAGFLISQHIFSFYPTLVIAIAAGLTGSLASYFIGVKGGKKLVQHIQQKGGMGAAKLNAALRWFDTYGGIAVLTGRILPGVRTFISLPAGMAEFSLVKFILYTVIGTVPWTLFLLYVGTLLGDNWDLILDYKWEISGVCILIAVIIGIIMYFMNRRKQQNLSHKNSQKETTNE